MMLIARFGRIVAGVALGSVSLFLTYHIRDLIVMDPNLVMRALKAAGLALVVPGLIAGILMGNIDAFRLWPVAAVNFVFWFGFGWLVATFISKFIKLRRAIAAVGVLADRSVSAEQSTSSSSAGPG
jgi:hypothetical protein